MGWACGTYGGPEMCIQGFGGETRGKDVSTHPSTTKKKNKETKLNLKYADLRRRLSQVCLTPSRPTNANLGVKETFWTTCSRFKIAPEHCNRYSDTYCICTRYSILLHFAVDATSSLGMQRDMSGHVSIVVVL